MKTITIPAKLHQFIYEQISRAPLDEQADLLRELAQIAQTEEERTRLVQDAEEIEAILTRNTSRLLKLKWDQQQDLAL